MPNTFAFRDTFARIDNLLATFSVEKSHAIALMLDPVVPPALGIVWMLYGVAHLTGQVEEPFMSFVEKTIKTALIVGVALGAVEWNDLLIHTFQDSPVALAAAISGTSNTDTTLSGFGVVLDGTIDNVVSIASSFFAQWINMYPILIGGLVLLVGLVVTIGAGFLILLGKVVTALILSFAPLFILALLFDWSKNFFTSYMNNLIAGTLLSALAVGANSLILSMFQQAAQKLAGLGATATISECSALLITGGIGLLVLWQVPSLAAGLGGGMSLSTFGIGRKLAGGSWNKATNKQGRDNKRDAKNRLDVEKRMDAMKDKAKPKADGKNYMKRKEVTRRRNGTND